MPPQIESILLETCSSGSSPRGVQRQWNLFGRWVSLDKWERPKLGASESWDDWLFGDEFRIGVDSSFLLPFEGLSSTIYPHQQLYGYGEAQPMTSFDQPAAAASRDMVTALSCADSLEQQLLWKMPQDQRQSSHDEIRTTVGPLQIQSRPVSRQLPSKSHKRAISLDVASSEIQFIDEAGLNAGTMIKYGLSSRKRKKFNVDERHGTWVTRTLGACERCKKLKKRCGRRKDAPFQLCDSCCTASPAVLKLPCFMESLLDAQLFRLRAGPGHPLDILRKSVYDLRDVALPDEGGEWVYLTQDLGHVLPIRVAEFVPEDGDKTAHTFKDASGRERVMEMPPYCIASIDEAKASILDYVQTSMDSYINQLQCANEITFQIFDEARRFVAFDRESAVYKALSLFAACRIIERDWRLCSEDSTTISVVSEDGHPWYGKRPVTPMMDCQLDQIVIQTFLQPLRKDLLEQLQLNINIARRKKWFEIFLTTFILLANAEQLLAHSRRNAIRHGAKARYNSPELAEAYFYACKTMIAHFHYVCNFSMSVSLDWNSDRGTSIAKLDRHQIDFLRSVQVRARDTSSDLLALRAGYKFEESSYWTHQIMFEGWGAGDVEYERKLISTTV